MPLSYTGGQAYASDFETMRALGLKTNFNRDFTDVGTVQYGRSTIKVEVAALPAQFYRFTIRRPSEKEDGEYETRVMTTGSGTFGEFYPVAQLIASNMLDVEAGGDAG